MSDSTNSSSEEDEMFENYVKHVMEEEEKIRQSRQQDEAFLRSLVPQITSSIQPPRRQRKTVHRDRAGASKRLFKDYFAEHPIYDDKHFRRRFRMRRHVFCRIMEALSAYDPYFEQKRDACGKLGHSTEAKCTAAMRLLAYGSAYDTVDEYCNVAETTASDCLMHFVDGVIAVFKDVYMRRPNAQDTASLLHEGAQRGFPGMMGSIDCMHWVWKNCPRGWKGQFQGRNKVLTLILEAVASRDLWIWHAFFGTPGSCNDINVLHRSNVFDSIMHGRAPPVEYEVNGHTYHMGYYLTDGIYPKWAAFIPSVHAPQTDKHKLFAQKQEAVRKDFERAFGVLQARFAIIKKPALPWEKDDLAKIMLACVIMHNMIVEDERSTYAHFDTTEFETDRPTNEASSSWEEDDDFVFTTSADRPSNEASSIASYLQNRSRVRDVEIHKTLKNDLIEHIWDNYHGGNDGY